MHRVRVETYGGYTSEYFDDVLNWDEATGVTVTRGQVTANIDFGLAWGLCVATVPDVGDMNEADANSVLAAAGLEIGIVTHEYSDTVPAGLVMDQHPNAEMLLVCGSTVDLVVSAGPRFEAPDLIGNFTLRRSPGRSGRAGFVRARLEVTNVGDVAYRGAKRESVEIEICVRPCSSSDDLSDILVATLTKRSIRNLKVGHSKKFNVKVRLPASLDGDYRLVAQIDSSDVVSESNENNNVAATSCFEIPDK
jgi:hypothetical protein